MSSSQKPSYDSQHVCMTFSDINLTMGFILPVTVYEIIKSFFWLSTILDKVNHDFGIISLNHSNKQLIKKHMDNITIEYQKRMFLNIMENWLVYCLKCIPIEIALSHQNAFHEQMCIEIWAIIRHSLIVWNELSQNIQSKIFTFDVEM